MHTPVQVQERVRAANRVFTVFLPLIAAISILVGGLVVGTAVGVAGVLVVTAIGAGARNEVIQRIESLGRNLLVVTASTVESRAGRRIQGSDRTQTLRIEDAIAIQRGSANIIRAAPALDRDVIAKFGPITNPTTVIGTTPEWQPIRQLPIARGRFFTKSEDDARARVAVLGHDARANLFPDAIDPIGRTVRIGTVPFEVVGVLASKGVSADGNATEDDRIIVPLQTALHRLFPQNYLKTIYLEAVAAEHIADAERDAGAILRVRHDLHVNARDDFVIQNQRAILAVELAAQTSFTRLILGLGFLALLVGGVGIMSVMLLSIRERRAEIGLRVATGARARDIVTQFLAESLILAICGGVLGVGGGVVIASVLSSATEWQAQVSALTIAIASSSAIAIGIGFGVFPAWKAASLDPIEALQA